MDKVGYLFNTGSMSSNLKIDAWELLLMET